VAEVLSQPEFAGLEETPRRLPAWLLEWLRRYAGWVLSLFDLLPDWFVWLVLAWLVLTLVAILGHLFYVLWCALPASRSRRVTGAGSCHAAGEILGIRELDFHSVHTRSLQLMDRKNWREATRYLYVAAILWLVQEGHLAFAESKTNADYLRELELREDFLKGLRQLTDLFEPRAYGLVAANAESCGEMRSLLDGLIHATA